MTESTEPSATQGFEPSAVGDTPRGPQVDFDLPSGRSGAAADLPVVQIADPAESPSTDLGEVRAADRTEVAEATDARRFADGATDGEDTQPTEVSELDALAHDLALVDEVLGALETAAEDSADAETYAQQVATVMSVLPLQADPAT